MRTTRFTAVLTGLLLLGSVSVHGEDWPGWRGPRGDGSSAETGLPLQWSADSGHVWKIELARHGHSSPIVAGDRVYVVGADAKTEEKKPTDEPRRRLLTAFDRATGQRLWEVDVDQTPLERKHHLNSWASSTPATDGERIFVSFLSGSEMLIAAFDQTGREVWKTRPGIFSSVHGYCSSPVVFENLLIVNGDHDGESYLVALDRVSGKTVWKTPRENRTRSYCTPLIRDVDGRLQMMLSGSKSVASFNPRTGERLWVLDGPTEQFVASLVYHDGLVFVTGGFPEKHMLAIDPRGSGNITGSDRIRWHHERRGVSYVPSPVAANGCFFIVSDNGIASCFDARSGKLEWEQRFDGGHSASLVAGDGRVYFLSDDGRTRVVRAAREFELLADNELGEPVYSSMAISGGQVFVRGSGHLFCIGTPRRVASRLP